MHAFPEHEKSTPQRRIVQLTSGPDFCYPLYYFIESITADGRYMVYHRETPGPVHEIQLHRLDLHTGESIPLTDARADDAHWQPWGVDPARGVLGDRSALAPQRGEVVYFDGRQARRVDLYSLDDQPIFDVPEDRFVLSQNCLTGDEQWFVYVHADRAAFEHLLEQRSKQPQTFRKLGHTCERTAMAAYNLDTGEHRTLFYINYPVHHVHPVGERGLAFSHIPGDLHGMGLADLDQSGYRIPRPQDAHGGKIIHHVPTARGIAYETHGRPGGWAGLLDPRTGRQLEFPVPAGVNHTGADPLGRLFFYQVGDDRIQVMRRYDAQGNHDWLDLFGSWPAFGKGQKTHFHPRLVLGRRWMQLVAGDARSGTNHICLVDVADLDRTLEMPAWD